MNVGILPGDLLAESGVAPEATKAATASLKEAISRVLNIFFLIDEAHFSSGRKLAQTTSDHHV